MPVTAGMRLGPYEILGPLGAGGMGEVYRARDARLGREVAIKLLRADALQTSERRRRFETEARAASALNHPNILTIHDIGEEDGAPYIVAELVEGESLRALLRAGSLPIRKLLDVAVQVAEGLAAAHAAGITHRDLKPENIMVTADGRVKILDFGLAKAAAPEQAEESRTLSDMHTTPGLVLGTVKYMSPEQARGRAVDFRSDQFSFGLILYEMATGKRPFERQDTLSTLSAIANEEPQPIATLNAQIPAPLRWVVDRCLAKEPQQRYASTSDLHQILRDTRDHLSEMIYSSGASVLEPPAGQGKARGRILRYSLLAATGLLAGALLVLGLLPRDTGLPVYQFTPFATEAVNEMQPAWSPDGQTIAYLADVDGINQIFTRTLTSSVPAQISKAAAACVKPFWAPDGTRIYFLSRGDLWSVGAAGGEPQMAVRGPHAFAAISPRGDAFVFSRYKGAMGTASAGLWLRSIADGKEAEYKQAPFPDRFRFIGDARFSPDGSKISVGLMRELETGVEGWIIPYPSGKPWRVPSKVPPVTEAASFDWMPDNRHLVLASRLSEGTPFRLYLVDTVRGSRLPITQGVNDELQPSVSPDGRRIAFVAGGLDFNLLQGTLDNSTVSNLLATERNEMMPAWSPSGRQILYLSDAGGPPELWLRDLEERAARPVVLSQEASSLSMSRPSFSPDGQRVAYVRVGLKHAIFVANLAGGREVPVDQQSGDQHATCWSPDGHWIAYARYLGDKWEIAKTPSGGGGQAVHLAVGGDPSSIVQWSPAGGWLVYSDAAGLNLVSADGATQKNIRKSRSLAFAFSKDGSKVYLVRRAPNRTWEMAAIDVPDGAETKVTDLNLPADAVVRDLSVHPDGKRFALAVGTSKQDIWILDGYRQPSRWFGWLR